ncbi:GTPase domain-containing protein [Marinicella gelatinilytica]|uniref:GTPase domain-containing protein n=1 Tax=Marinicella gelatinilytica TaxID=2996017 RepID=UPI0022608B58|nr:GTPase domain-containing protein [Marinicella gelatinilytica]MCX7545305.1 GTPase domain-containing protein [Marinicella gelatinilytica]
MKLNSKSILAVVLLTLGLLLLLLMLVLAEKLLSIWHYLQQAPVWFWLLYALAIMIVALLPLWMWFKWTRPKNQSEKKPKIIDEAGLQQALETAQSRGIDITSAQQELDELQRRRQNKRFYICLFGGASSGKSSFIQALIPTAHTEIDVIKGTTLEVLRYQHENLEVTDLPGFDAIEQDHLSRLALAESRRAHVVIFMLSGDFSRSEMMFFESLKDWHKPMVIALNKSDRYQLEELQQIKQAIADKTEHKYPVVAISTGGFDTVIRKQPDGRQLTETITRQPDIAPLIRAVKRVIAEDSESLHRFRDAGMLMLAERTLTEATAEHNKLAAMRTIERHSRRAMVGAMASIAPGSDIIIQGAIGSQMVKELCQIYKVPIKQLQVDEILRAAGSKLKTSTSMVLAVAGNAFKSFPGLGTAAGGLLHAVAYGLIFNALGRAVLTTINETGRLDSEQTKQIFEDNLLGSSDKMAKNLAQMALAVKAKKSSQNSD